MSARWTAAWRATLSRSAAWKTLEGGRRRESTGSGAAREVAKKSAATATPAAVICASPCLTPSRKSADIMKALTRQFSARILKICSVVTSVHRPWSTTLRTQSTLVRRAVNGDAIDASPSRTSVGSPSASDCSRRMRIARSARARSLCRFRSTLRGSTTLSGGP